MTHDGPAYVGEEYPISVIVTNDDDRALEVHMDVLLQPTEADDAGASYHPLFLCHLSDHGQ
jgi:hypothetical protein